MYSYEFFFKFNRACYFFGWSGGTNLATLALMRAVTIEPTRPACFSAGGILFWIFSWFTGFIPAHLEVTLSQMSRLKNYVFQNDNLYHGQLGT